MSKIAQIGNLIDDTINLVNTVGRRRVPRYTYHFTTIDNYEKIVRAKEILASKDNTYGTLSGVFMFDLKNLTKRWRGSKDWSENHFLSIALLNNVAANRSKNLVLLRIPTKKLDINNLKIRSQNEYFRGVESSHLITGAPATRAQHYTRKKEAIEYIYQDSIPTTNVEYVGEINLDDAMKKVNLDVDITKASWEDAFIPHEKQKAFTLQVLKDLFKSSSEKKALDIIT